MPRPIRHPLLLLALPLAVLLAAAGCGVSYKLPTEIKVDRGTPKSESYQMVDTWTGLTGINDLLMLSQVVGPSQLFMLFNDGGTGPGSHGTVLQYRTTVPTPLPVEFLNMLNPVRMSSGGNRLFVLDQGDTCAARYDSTRFTCRADDTNPPDNRPYRIWDYSKTWRVREYGLLGGDTISTFTDTTMAWVNGVAADNEGRVYVSGLQIVVVVDPLISGLHTRETHFQINRYARGKRYPGVVEDPSKGVTPYDRNMPGCLWHRDTTWTIFEGSGIGSIVDARGLACGPKTAQALHVADYGKDWAQKISVGTFPVGLFEVDFGDNLSLKGPKSVAVDQAGYLYVIDNGNLRVLRYSPSGDYVQRVDVDPDEQGQRFRDPVGVAVNDSVAYVADRALGKVVRYVRRSL